MYTQVRTSGGITLVPIESRLMGERKVYIEGEINREAAQTFEKQITLLNMESHDPIDVHISSLGGEVQAGLYMYDIIQDSPAPIRMFCCGVAYSMAAVLFATGRNGRFMLPHSKLMLHEPLIDSGLSGSASSIRSISDSLLQTKRQLSELLSKHTGKTIEEIEEASAYDHYFDAEQSMAFGLADGILRFDQVLTGGRWKEHV